MTNVHTPMAFDLKLFAFKRWEDDLRLNCFLYAVKSFYRLWHLLTQSIRGWKQTQTWSDLCLVPVCAAHTDTEPWCAVAWAVLRHALCVDAAPACGCVGQTTCFARMPPDWCCLGSLPDLGWCDTSPSTPDWFKCVLEMQLFGKPRSFSWKVGCCPCNGTCLEWEMMTCPSSTANAIAVWVRIQDHAWASLRLVISWPGIHQTTAGTQCTDVEWLNL